MKFKIKVKYIIDGYKLGRTAWLVGKGEDLAIGNIYTDADKAESYSESEIAEIIQRDAFGEKFLITGIVAA